MNAGGNVFGKRHRAICLSANQIALFNAPIGYTVVFSCFSKTLFTSVADQCDFLAYLFSCKLHFLHVLKLAVVYIHATVALP